MRLRLALHYDVREPAGTPEQVSRLHAALLDHAALGEALGFEVVWIAEHPADPEAAIPSALLLCAALAARTQSLRFGTGVLPLPLYHPLRVAEDAATIDGIASGRFELGVGLGGEREGFHGFGIAARERAQRLEESVVLLRQAWSDEPVRFEGAHFAIRDIEVVPKPVQPGGPPLWIGAGAREAQRRAARLEAGLFLPPDARPEDYLAAWGESGRDFAEARVAVPRNGAPDDAAAPSTRTLRKFTQEIGGLDIVISGFASGRLRNEEELARLVAIWRDALA